MSATDATTRERDADERLRELPPSAKLVYKVLEYDGSLTQGQLADETLLPPRTVRYATSRLEEAGVVDSRFSFTDARKRLYSIGADPTATGTASD
jgi:DNA-binding MarR family transcriptional regulator